jgi:hypothetical protein
MKTGSRGGDPVCSAYGHAQRTPRAEGGRGGRGPFTVSHGGQLTSNPSRRARLAAAHDADVVLPEQLACLDAWRKGRRERVDDDVECSARKTLEARAGGGLNHQIDAARGLREPAEQLGQGRELKHVAGGDAKAALLVGRLEVLLGMEDQLQVGERAVQTWRKGQRQRCGRERASAPNQQWVAEQFPQAR